MPFKIEFARMISTPTEYVPKSLIMDRASQPPKWKRYEDLVANVQRAVAPGATVIQNEKVRGRITGVLREIDISIRENVGQFKLFIAIDRKDYRNPLDVKDIEAFAGLLEDVGANKGAMIAANGYSEAAKAVARAKGIDLYRLLETEHIEWRNYVTVPALIRNLHLSFRIVFHGHREEIESLLLSNETMLFSDGETPASARALVLNMWKCAVIPEDPGEYTLPITDRPVFIQHAGRVLSVAVNVDARVSYQWFFGQLPLTAVRGFVNELDGSFKFDEFTTDWLHFAEVAKSWQRISSPDELAVRPVITFLLKDAPSDDPDAWRSMRLHMTRPPE